MRAQPAGEAAQVPDRLLEGGVRGERVRVEEARAGAPARSAHPVQRQRHERDVEPEPLVQPRHVEGAGVEPRPPIP